MGMRQEKQLKGMEPATANVRPSQSSLSIRSFGGKEKREVECGEGCL